MISRAPELSGMAATEVSLAPPPLEDGRRGIEPAVERLRELMVGRRLPTEGLSAVPKTDGSYVGKAVIIKAVK
jgi:hypothetical protein